MKLANSILFLAYFNEIYVLGLGRVFDLIVYLLTIVLVFRKTTFPKGLVIVTGILILLNLISFMLYGNVRLATALFFGALLLLYSSSPSSGFVVVLIRIHLMAFLVQVLFYYVFHIHVSIGDIVPGLDTSRNLNADLDFYRPSGLFLEPNAFVVNSAFLLILSWKYIPVKLFWTQVFAILLSKSLFGFLFIAVVLFFLLSRRWKILAISVSLVVLGVGSNYLGSLASSDYVTLRRVNDILEGKDASISARLTKRESANFLDYVVPHAVDFNTYSKLFGINGISMLIYTLGVVGWLLIYFILLKAKKSMAWTIFGLTLLSYPYIAYSIFYLVLRHLFVERSSS